MSIFGGKGFNELDVDLHSNQTVTGKKRFLESSHDKITGETHFMGVVRFHEEVEHLNTIVQLDQIDNTSDLNKPISTATQNALDLKTEHCKRCVQVALGNNDTYNISLQLLTEVVVIVVDEASEGVYTINFTGTPIPYKAYIYKLLSYVSLSGRAMIYANNFSLNGVPIINVINISLKPPTPSVRTYQEVTLTFNGSITAPSMLISNIMNLESIDINTLLDLKTNIADTSNMDNTSDLNKPISTATQAALSLKSSFGYAVYNDLATETVPLTNNYIVLTNDTLGSETDTSFLPPGFTGLWDSVNSAFNFSTIPIGSIVTIAFLIYCVPGLTNTSYDFYLKLGLSEYNYQWGQGYIKGTTPQLLTVTNFIHVNSTDITDYPIVPRLGWGSSCTTTIKSFRLKIDLF